MKKIILMLGLILLLTGCTIKYDIKVNFDGSAEENSNFIVSKDILKADDMGDTPEEFVDSFVDVLKQKSGNYRYHAQKIINSTTMGFNAYKKYNTISSLAGHSPFITYLYNGLRVTKNGSIVILESMGKFKKSAVDCEWCDYPKIQGSYLAIRLPYKVVNSNASSVDEKQNIYYWRMEYNNYPESIYLEYDTNILYSYNIIDWLPFINYYLVGIIGVVIIIGIIFLYFNYRRKQTNII